MLIAKFKMENSDHRNLLCEYKIPKSLSTVLKFKVLILKSLLNKHLSHTNQNEL